MAPASAILHVEGGPLAGQSFVVDRSPFNIGRSPENHLIVPDTPVSRQHARLELQGGRWFLRDLGSSNGTFLNRQAVTDSPEPLRDGDLLGIGDSVFVFTAQASQIEAHGRGVQISASQQRGVRSETGHSGGRWVMVAIAVVLVVLVAAALLLFSGLVGNDREAGSTPGLPSIGLPTGLPSALPTVQFQTSLPTLQVPTGFPTGLPIATGLPSIPSP